ncbi:signal recognition particle-docking protein FtsY [Candidatus Woesearchaeota archaeon]|nr:signal recognition particle-docking protein FtsY [Candidatus Woesearchaeota archaeon]
MIFEEAPLTFNPASGGFEPDIEKIKEKEIFVPDEKKEHRHAEIQKPEHQAVPKPHEDKEDIVFTQPSPAPPSESEKKGFFAKLKETITKKIISEEQFDELFWELEVALLESNVAVEVIEKIKADLKQDVVGKPLSRGKIEEIIQQALTHSIDGLFSFSTFEIADRIRQQKEKPTVIVFMGVNGTGKTTTIAKVAKRLQDEKLTCVIAAADTFRAAALEQLQTHADNLHIKLIKHQYGSDPAAVAFDAIAHARARGVDAVLIDTAGRLHSNENLMEELKKVVRVAKPDLILFVGESITGNDCVEQVKIFGSYVNIDGVILSKADLDEKGGAAVSLSYVSGKPILYLGTGQNYDDLEPFDKAKMMERLGMV